MRASPYIGLHIVIAILALLPFVLPNSFYMDLAIRMAINAVIVLGLNLLIGFAGQISLGHAGFLGIGAYASAVLPTHFGWHPLLAMGAGAAATGSGLGSATGAGVSRSTPLMTGCCLLVGSWLRRVTVVGSSNSSAIL